MKNIGGVLQYESLSHKQMAQVLPFAHLCRVGGGGGGCRRRYAWLYTRASATRVCNTFQLG